MTRCLGGDCVKKVTDRYVVTRFGALSAGKFVALVVVNGRAPRVITLHHHLLQPSIITPIIPQQTATVQAAFATLVRGNGAALAQPFLAAYGNVCTPQDWYRGLATMVGDTSPAEQLFVLGLVYLWMNPKARFQKTAIGLSKLLDKAMTRGFEVG